jgi:gamma-glutamyltranspeptidase/glutathione hydrolase
MNAWQNLSGTPFTTEKRPAQAARGMVVTNHPLASAAGTQMLCAGGNAVDAAVAALFTLSVVEPMMVGLLGGGFAHLRQSDGTHCILEGQGTCPQAVGPHTFEYDASAPPGSLESVGRRHSLGRGAVATPGNLMAWCQMLARHGSMSLEDVLAPALQHASRGFRVTQYLSGCITDNAADLALDPEIARVFLPGGQPLQKGDRLQQGAYADTLKLVAQQGAAALYGDASGPGALGQALCADMATHQGFLTLDDLQRYRTREPAPLRSSYRGFDIIGPPPPCAGPLHIGQMLNVLQGFDLRALGFGTVDSVHLLAEVLKMAFADRAAVTADPDFVNVPVQRLLSTDYADLRRGQIDLQHAKIWAPGLSPTESAHTTHITVADSDGRVVSATQTINSVFGARYMVPDTGLIPNNYLYVLDPRPDRANSMAPGKRVTSSMAPLMVLQDGQPRYALGLPGGLRIFPSALQALVNLIDHRMSLQQAVEAPRIWTQGFELELEPAFSPEVQAALQARGHAVLRVPNVGGGMNAIAFHDDGLLEGAACWRADGTPIGIGGGMAREGVRFLPETRKP